jgi:hypothetical protein
MPQAEAAMNMKTAKEAAAKGCASIGNKDMRNATTAPANAIRSTHRAKFIPGLEKQVVRMPPSVSCDGLKRRGIRAVIPTKPNRNKRLDPLQLYR